MVSNFPSLASLFLFSASHMECLKDKMFLCEESWMCLLKGERQHPLCGQVQQAEVEEVHYWGWIQEVFNRGQGSPWRELWAHITLQHSTGNKGLESLS